MAKSRKMPSWPPGAKPAPLPGFIAPALAKPAAVPPSGPNWIHEVKLDGYRLQARIDGRSVQLFTRTGLDWTHRFKKTAAALAKLDLGAAVIDGEVVAEDDAGLPSFPKLVGALKSGEPASIAFFAFDLLYCDGMDLKGVPLLGRKSLLKARLPTRSAKSIRYTEHFDCDGAELLAQACALGLEGIISKRSDKPYRSGRTDDWLKAKCVNDDEFVIVGYLDSTAMPKAIGALVLGYFDDGALIYAGRAGTGFDHKMAASLWAQLQPLRSAPHSFVKGLTALQRRDVRWLRPGLVAQIEYRGWTADRLLRQAAFKALREDKPATAVSGPSRKQY